MAFLAAHSTPAPTAALLDSHSPSPTSPLHLHSSGFIPSVSEETDSSPEVLSENCFQTAGITFELWVGSGFGPGLSFALFSLVWSPSGMWDCLFYFILFFLYNSMPSLRLDPREFLVARDTRSF